MRVFSRQAAGYFCSGFSGSTSTASLTEIYDNDLAGRKKFKESEQIYSVYRDSLIRESDRAFFLGVSCFRRTLDVFTASSMFWVHVGLYYSGWFAAQSILGMFGCWIGGSGGRVVDVEQDKPGSQEFQVHKKYPSVYRGKSHQYFWDLYYQAMQPLVVWTDAALQLAVTPVANNPIWAIHHRNIVNYEMQQSFRLMDDYRGGVDPAQFPKSLSGEIATQFQLSRSLLLFSAAR